MRPGEHFIYGSVKAGQFLLDYAEAGPDDAAVTLVSLPGSAGLEMSTAKDLLSRRHRIIEINPPGWGGRTDLDRPMDMAEVGALQGEAANRLIEGQYYVLGTSMGGVAAIHLAARYPDRVRGIILEASMAPVLPSDLYAPPPADIQAEGGDYPLPPTHPNKPWATDDFVRQQMSNRFAMFRWIQLDMLPIHALSSLATSGIGVLALLGDHDEILKPSARETLTKYLPTADVQLVPDGTHDLQNITPEQFVARTKTFLLP